MAALGTAVMAGIGEEIGLVHFLNLLKGAALSDTIWQCISAVGIGVIFGAIYLRTGNIVLCMILHAHF